MGRRWTKCGQNVGKHGKNVGRGEQMVGKMCAHVPTMWANVGKMCAHVRTMWANVGMWAALKTLMEHERLDGLGWEWVRWKGGEEGYKMRVVRRDSVICPHPNGPLG